jgi:hypothetical protein
MTTIVYLPHAISWGGSHRMIRRLTGSCFLDAAALRHAAGMFQKWHGYH